MRIFLTGFMGAGKSTVGRIVSAQLGMLFTDLDTDIERVAGRDIAGIFEDLEESGFRDLEWKCLQSVPDSAVIATGGGCFIHNADWMLANGTVVYLEVPFEVLARRTGGDPKRPLWKNAERLFCVREPAYRRAHITVDAAQDPDLVAAQVRKLVSG